MDLEKLIPPHVVQACQSYGTEDDGGATATIEIGVGGRVTLHIRTDEDHWYQRMFVKDFLADVSGAWAPGLAWLGF